MIFTYLAIVVALGSAAYLPYPTHQQTADHLPFDAPQDKLVSDLYDPHYEVYGSHLPDYINDQDLNENLADNDYESDDDVGNEDRYPYSPQAHD
ncbi:hypothetical protein DSO57_1012211 [Entomophthora muscae]|uniref:Uncharacterized protein n=1 Tax=Entomophthora muscae TaxID=34485 RepID=A0ACC2URJ9_9FUNG|nr:hypothetical protein DSO57_1012211 [Entomophthora muscae]